MTYGTGDNSTIPKGINRKFRHQYAHKRDSYINSLKYGSIKPNRISAVYGTVALRLTEYQPLEIKR